MDNYEQAFNLLYRRVENAVDFLIAGKRPSDYRPLSETQQITYTIMKLQDALLECKKENLTK